LPEKVYNWNFPNSSSQNLCKFKCSAVKLLSLWIFRPFMVIFSHFNFLPFFSFPANSINFGLQQKLTFAILFFLPFYFFCHFIFSPTISSSLGFPAVWLRAGSQLPT